MTRLSDECLGSVATGLVLWKSRKNLSYDVLLAPLTANLIFFIYCCQSHSLLRSLSGWQKAPCARVCLDTHDFHKGLEIHKQNKLQQHFHYVYYSRALCVIALIWPDQSYVRGLWAADQAALTYKIFHVSSHAALWFTTPGTQGQQEHLRNNTDAVTTASKNQQCQIWFGNVLSDVRCSSLTENGGRFVCLFSCAMMLSEAEFHQLCFSGTAVCTEKHSWGVVCQQMTFPPRGALT